MFRLLVLSAGIACLAAAPARAGGVLTVSFDVEPTECPNLFNPYLRDLVLPTAVLGSDILVSNNIQPSSLVLVVPGGGGLLETRIHPIGVTLDVDVAAPVGDPSDCRCSEDGPEGILDASIAFDAGDIAQALCQTCEEPRVPICIEGLLLDGTPFRGCDCITVITPLPTSPESWGKVKSTYR